MQRRHLLQGLIAGGTLGLTGCASLGGTSASKAKVLVIGGGYGGTTASKYIRLLSDYTIDVIKSQSATALVPPKQPGDLVSVKFGDAASLSMLSVP